MQYTCYNIQWSVICAIPYFTITQSICVAEQLALQRLYIGSNPLEAWFLPDLTSIYLYADSLQIISSITLHDWYTVEKNIKTVTWATSWENLFMPYANNKGTDQPAHQRSLISTFVVRCLDSIITTCYLQNFKTLASFWSWVGQFESYLVTNPEDRFSRDKAHQSIYLFTYRSFFIPVCLIWTGTAYWIYRSLVWRTVFVEVVHWFCMLTVEVWFWNERTNEHAENFLEENWAATWQNQHNDICAQRRLRSAWASAQSDQSLHCALSG